jgi:hypothetical protein
MRFLSKRLSSVATSSVRELRIYAPSDCIVSNTPTDNEQALQQIETVLKGNLATSSQLSFRRDVSRRKGKSS